MYKIGNTYKVPCAVFNYAGRHYVLPVYDHIHDDAENGQNYPHYHVDFRFVSRKHYGFNTSPKNWPPMRVNLDRSDMMQFIGIRYRYRRFHRHEHEGTTGTVLIGMSKLDWSKVEEMKCPHRGYDLTNLIPDCNGVVTCPLHGIKVKLKTNS